LTASFGEAEYILLFSFLQLFKISNTYCRRSIPTVRFCANSYA